MAKRKKSKDVSRNLLKKRFLTWYKNHPDVKQFAQIYSYHPGFNQPNFQTADINPLWFVINLMGDLIEWTDSPMEWIEDFEKKKFEERIRTQEGL